MIDNDNLSTHLTHPVHFSPLIVVAAGLEPLDYARGPEALEGSFGLAQDPEFIEGQMKGAPTFCCGAPERVEMAPRDGLPSLRSG
jgi:hypothetical protein